MGNNTYEVVFAGAGHNALTAACYLAKAGVNVCLVERHPYVGGGVLTQEVAAPGFKTDICSMIHQVIQANPLVTNDELGLFSKYGMKYVYPDVQMVVHFDDGTYFSVCKDLEDTIASVAKFSEKDAEAYRKFHAWSIQSLDLMLSGLFSPPPPFGSFVAMMDQSDEGRDLLRALMQSTLDIVNSWFENEKVRIALGRWVSEIMVMPHTKGTGLVFYLMLGLIHKFPGGVPVGGSGALSEAMERCISDHGGTIKTSSPIKEFKVVNGECKGVVLDSGEEILASKAVVSNLHIQHIFPGMVQGASLPDGFEKRVQNLLYSDFMCFQQGLALHEAPKYKVGGDADKALLVEFAPSDLHEFVRYFEDLAQGVPHHYPNCACLTPHDPTRAPEGKHTLYFYEYAPYTLKDGGAAKWDEIREQYAEDSWEYYRQYTTNMGPENFVGNWIQSPLDLERHNPSFIHGDFAALGPFLEQSVGNRPLPGWNYRMPIEKLYLCGPCTHPGCGVTGGGRAAVQVIMEDMGIDFESVIS